MRRLIALFCLILATTFALGQAVFADAPLGLKSKGGGGRIGPASLDLDTCGCPTSFGTPTCERKTLWSLSNMTSTGTLTDPEDAAYQFTVSVTEERTEDFLSGEGTIVLTNSGESTTFLSSVAVSLEDQHDGPGQGNAPGPSGKNWNVLATAVRTKMPGFCGNTAMTCYGEITATEGAWLEVYDPENNDVAAMLGDLSVPPTVDNDGDGLRDEDPSLPSDPSDLTGGCSVIDNDGDGLYDEDPIDFETVGYDDDGDGIVDRYVDEPVDNDGDGLFNEDDPDDDGDGRVDEDGACDDGVVIHFRYRFPIGGLGIEGPGDGVVPSEDDLRIDLIATFKSGGRRGGTCAVDVDCDGTADQYVRSIQQRLQFDPIPCEPVCDTVILADDGASASDPGCVSLTPGSLYESISATGVDGTTWDFSVGGTVSCNGIQCGANVSNSANLTGGDCAGTIEGSPSSASFAVECSEAGPEFDPGDFLTHTQERWGESPNGSNPAAVLSQYYESVFDEELLGSNYGSPARWGSVSSAAERCESFNTVCDGGSPCDLTWLKVGHDELHVVPPGFTILPPWGIYLSSACAVEDFLPQMLPPGVLSYSFADPTTTASGIFGGQLTAAKINVAFDSAGIRTDGQPRVYPAGMLRTLRFVDGCVHPALVGRTAHQVLAWSDCVISGEPFNACGVPAGVTVDDLSDALTVFNENFADGTTSLGCLGTDPYPKLAADSGPGDASGNLVPARTALLPNTPNPFNPRTEIAFSLDQAGLTRLTIYDISGRAVRQLVNGRLAAGEHRIVWDGQDDTGNEVSSGVYVYRLQTGQENWSRRMVLLR